MQTTCASRKAVTATGRLFTEDGPWASDTVTNFYNNGLRTNLVLAQPTGKWTNGFAYDSAKRLTCVESPAESLGCFVPCRKLLRKTFAGKLLLAQVFWVCCIALHA